MRRFLKILAALVVVVAVAVTAAVYLIPKEKIVQLASDKVREATGRELTLDGSISPSFWPVLGVRIDQVALSNADWGEVDHIVTASAAEIGVELMPLLSSEVKITTLRLVDPVVSLEVNDQGQGNWIFETSDDGSTSTASGASIGPKDELPEISLPEAVITNGTIRFTDAQTGQRIELLELDLTAGLAGLDAPLSALGSGLWNGERVSLEARVETPAAVIQGEHAAVKLALTSAPANFIFEGAVQVDPAAALPLVDGALSVDVPNPSQAAGWASGAAASAGLAEIGAVKLDGTVVATQTSLKLAASGSVGYKGRAVAFDVDANGGTGWLQEQAFTVAASGRSDGLFSLSFNGPASLGIQAAKGALAVRIPDVRGLAEWAGGSQLDAPAGTLESMELDAGLTLAVDRIDMSNLTMTIDQTQLTGQAGVALGARPHISANLTSGPLDLTPFMGPSGGGGASSSGGGAQPGWSTDPLDLSALRTVDADVAIRAEAVDLGDIEIGRSDINAKLRNGRLDIRLDRVDAYGGGISGNLVLIAGEQAELATDVTVSQVQLRPLLSALAGIDNLEGVGAFRINAAGQGGSMDALMRSLDGNGGLDLTDGAILGVNLAAVVRNLTGQAGGDERTDFSAVTGTFDITDGVLHNSDFSFLGPLLRVVGAGTVDLGRQRQDFRLEPKAVASLTGQGGAIGDTGLGVFPILITGTWSNPQIRPDLTAAIEGLLTDPNKAIDTVTGLVDGVKGADPNSLLGAITGGALGDQGGGDQEGSSGGGALGSLLGALGGAQGGQQGGSDSTLAQPTYENEGTTGSTGGSGGNTAGGALGTLLGALGGNDTATTVPQPSAQQHVPSGEISKSPLAPANAPYPAPAPRSAGLSVPSQQYEVAPSSEPAPKEEPKSALEEILKPDKDGKVKIKPKDFLKILKP